MLKVAKTVLVVNKVETDRGRSTAHNKQPAYCATCTPKGAENPIGWSTECESNKHRKRHKDLVTVTENAPQEAARVSQLYGKAYRAFHGLGYAAGRQVYLIHADKKQEIQKIIEEVESECAAANFEMKVCHITFSPKVVDIVPEDAYESTLASIRNDVEESVSKLLTALESGDLETIKKTVNEAKNVADLIEGPARTQVKGLDDFARKTAKELNKAAKLGDEKVKEEQQRAREGAVRFATIFKSLLAEDAPAEEAPAEATG